VELDPETGVPAIIYTGVYLKANAGAVAALGLPPAQYDMPTRFVETQLAAVPADPGEAWWWKAAWWGWGTQRGSGQG
jgi:hypothetical protein